MAAFYGDIANTGHGFQAIVPRALTSTVTSAVMDMNTSQGGLGTSMVLSLGAVSGSGSPTLDVKLQECDTTNGTFTDIAGASFAQQTTTKTDADAILLKTTFKRAQRYCKVAAVVGGTTSPSFTAGVAVFEQKRYG